MYTPTAEAASRAFGLGPPTTLVHVRSGDTDTWRLETTTGAYFVKGYRDTSAGQFMAESLREQLEAAMTFEQKALDAGIDMPRPIRPPDPTTGCLTTIEGRLFRAYEWVEHRAVRHDDDLPTWLGRTMARIHQLEPRDEGLPDWWRGAIRPPDAWADCITDVKSRGMPWADLANDRLPHILESTARIERLCDRSPPPDCVQTHGDFKTHNLLMTPGGPLLIDWDSVRIDSAALEAARVAYIFGAGELDAMQRVLHPYEEAGGDLEWPGEDALLSVTRHDLQGLFERIRVALGRRAAPWWMGDSDTIEHDIEELLRDLPDRTERLRTLAASL